MSDEIFITIHDDHKCDSLSIVAEGTLVTSVNKQIGAVELTRTDIPGYSDLELSSYSTLSSTSALWVDTSTLVQLNSSNWDESYSYINQTSAIQYLGLDATTFILQSSANAVEVITTVNNLSSDWVTSYYWITSNSINSSFVSVFTPLLSGSGESVISGFVMDGGVI